MMNTHEQQIIQTALTILHKYQKSTDIVLNKAPLVVNFLKLKFSYCEREIFSILFLNNQNQLLAFEEMFYGTINQAAIHPREIVKRAMTLNAAAVILAHNHPSGHAVPSGADVKITEEIVKILALVDVNVLDHIIIGANTHVSFHEQGLL